MIIYKDIDEILGHVSFIYIVVMLMLAYEKESLPLNEQPSIFSWFLISIVKATQVRFS